MGRKRGAMASCRVLLRLSTLLLIGCFILGGAEPLDTLDAAPPAMVGEAVHADTWKADAKAVLAKAKKQAAGVVKEAKAKAKGAKKKAASAKKKADAQAKKVLSKATKKEKGEVKKIK